MEDFKAMHEFENMARATTYFIGAHIRGVPPESLNEIEVSLTAAKLEFVKTGETILALMIQSFIDGFRSAKPPSI